MLEYKLGVSVPEIYTSQTFNKINISPNPVIDNSLITYEFKSITNYSLKIYNNNGQLIKSHSGESNKVVYNWNGTNQKGTVVSPGIYFISIESKNDIVVKKIVKY